MQTEGAMLQIVKEGKQVEVDRGRDTYMQSNLHNLMVLDQSNGEQCLLEMQHLEEYFKTADISGSWHGKEILG